MERERINAALHSGKKIRPSSRNPWDGAPVPGSRWTRQQLHWFAQQRRFNPDTIPTHPVPLKVPSRIDWSMPDDTIHLTCPLIAMSKSGKRVLVITPSGDKLWTDAA